MLHLNGYKRHGAVGGWIFWHSLDGPGQVASLGGWTWWVLDGEQADLILVDLACHLVPMGIRQLVQSQVLGSGGVVDHQVKHFISVRLFFVPATETMAVFPDADAVFSGDLAVKVVRQLVAEVDLTRS